MKKTALQKIKALLPKWLKTFLKSCYKTYYTIQPFWLVKIRLKNGEKIIQLKFFETILLQKDSANLQFFIPRKQPDTSIPAFYLKVNLLHQDYVFPSLQHWVNIAEYSNPDIYIVCDNLELKRMIYKKIIFKNANIKFIKSKNTHLKRIVKRLCIGKSWYPAGMAHLTTFYHAKKMGYPSFWNIDADDTMMFNTAESIGRALKEVEEYANSHRINLFSFDMHYSKTMYYLIKNWGFGVTYTRDYECFIEAFEHKKIELKQITKNMSNPNLDSVVDFLRDSNFGKIESFYIENSYFIHWYRYINFFVNFGLTAYHNNKLEYPIYMQIMQDEKLGLIDIAYDCVKFDCGFTKEEAFKCMFDNIIYPNFKGSNFPIKSKYLTNI